MTSGGAQLSGGDDGADAVGKDDPNVHGGTEVRGVRFAEMLCDDQQRDFVTSLSSY